MPAFSDLVDEFLAEHHAEHPVQSSTLGLTDYDNLLDDLSAAGYERRRAAEAKQLRGMGRRDVTMARF